MRIRAGWWTRCVAAWGERAAEILAANNEHPPMVLRVDPGQLHAEDFLRSWRAMGREARAVEWNADAVVLERPVAVQILPGFEAGSVSVQDGGAQLAAPLLDAQAGMRVLDACAAPGGKTLHIAQRTPALAELVAVDDDPRASAACAKTSSARGRDAVLLSADLRTVPPSLARDSFDRVLVDAPCSATGVIRRHPDIKLLRRASDIESFVAHPAKNSRHGFRTTEAGRTSHLLHLFGDPGGERGRGRRFPARRAARRARRLARKPHAAARIARSAGRLAVVAGRERGYRWLLLCLSSLKPRGTDAVPSRA